MTRPIRQITLTPHAHHELQVLTFVMSAALERKVTYSEAVTIAAEIVRTHPEAIAPCTHHLDTMATPPTH